ncbi:lipid asymmetry maintenance protein MlaB [Chitinibacter sp. GC72]|uniref:STAS domain-containing protein n=1 Tax=Chitinibacter sp. GC72 TaxID=1526917 RepID=UPI0012FC7D74|nr:STAS domain-containing protein [Chitinibacter sp. GC72]
MSTPSSPPPETAAIQANHSLTIFEAAEQKSTLLTALSNSSKSLEVNLSGVDDIDSTGIQLLLFLKQEAQRQQKAVVYTHHSPTVLGVIELLNLAAQLGDPLLMPRGETA